MIFRAGVLPYATKGGPRRSPAADTAGPSPPRLGACQTPGLIGTSKELM